jgi:cell division protein ZapD
VALKIVKILRDPKAQLPLKTPLSKTILYEFPLNERTRLFMRLEKLFQEIAYFSQGASYWDSRAALATLSQLLAILGRHDLKAELLKEIERHTQFLIRLAGNPHADEAMVSSMLVELQTLGRSLNMKTEDLGQSFMETDLFRSLSGRSSIRGGVSSFDLPALHHWLEQDSAKRSEDLGQWLEPFATLKSAILLLIEFLRGSATTTHETARAGSYQKTLDHNMPFQLLRVLVDRRYPCFAEISGGRHRFTVRFMSHASSGSPAPFHDDVEFGLACCLL